MNQFVNYMIDSPLCLSGVVRWDDELHTEVYVRIMQKIKNNTTNNQCSYYCEIV